MPEYDIYNAGQVLGKTLIAQRIVDVYNKVPDMTGSKKIAGVKPGLSVGVVDSWVTNSLDKSIWWQFRNTDGTFYFTKHEPGLYSINALKQQGALSTLEQIEEEKKKQEAADKPWYAWLGESAEKAITTGAIVIGVVIIAKAFITSQNNKK